LTVVSLTGDRQESSHADQLRKLGVEVLTFEVPRWINRIKATTQLTTARPLTHVLLDAPGIGLALQRLIAARPPDVVLAFCSGMARFAMEPPLDRFPLVVDMVDVDSAKWAALAEIAGWPRRWVYRREARLLSHFERDTAMRASCTLVVNDREAQLLREIAPNAVIRVLPVGADLTALAPPSPPTADPTIVFCGVMNYSPNIQAVVWFTEQVWPRIRSSRPDARLIIVGSDPALEVRRLAEMSAGVVVTGTVPDVRHYLWNAAVSIAPLQIARGVQTKVLEAVAAGVPAVVTSQVRDGLPAEILPACRVADSAEDFASEILSLLQLTADARRALAQQADLEPLSWETRLRPLRDILAAAAQEGASR
jgi:sugar transferase (PEP-CTERM/EpsH1 system associated)